ncbi:MAG: GspE/PulE family protein [Patescibacteria group bacterium]|nr:GspE/PulE family protein [Patescibacteria group bacterium]
MENNQNNQKRPKATKLDKVVGNLYRKKEEELTANLALKAGLEYANLANFQPEPDVVGLIPQETTEEFKVFPYKKEGRKVYVATLDKLDPKIEKLFKEQYPEYKFLPVLVSDSNMRYLLSIYSVFAPSEKDPKDLKITGIEQKNKAKTISEWEELAKNIKNIPVSELFEIMIASAAHFEASDIHIEPTKTAIELRFRIDGVLQDVAELPTSFLSGIINRTKILSELKLNVVESSQDGRFSIDIGKIHYDIRVSILPTAYGESAVLRLLPQTGKFIDLEKLGLEGSNAEIINSIIKKPNGLILNTGPTGSGKTTTLYAILDKINSPDKKIITIEDPIEYRLKGITQSQINPEENYTFATGLKAILRQDPDIILVGEIRDKDTANIAINASLTGHLVLSTLHTNNAAGAIPRLADLGLKPSYFIESILAVIAQRLLRKLCPECAEEYSPSPEELEIINQELEDLPENIAKPNIKTLKRPPQNPKTQCSVCNGLGYKGRIGIFEILQTNNEIVKAVLASATIGDIETLAKKNGMITLKQDGILKVIQGVTTLEELNRVAGRN